MTTNLKSALKSLAKIAAIALVAITLPTGLALADSAPAAVSTSTVGVQLFEWNWNSVAKECTTHLGPEGYSWALVSPPQEHIVGSQWWVHYQPTSYKLESNLGTRAEFANMVSTCNQAGVAIIVDAVINHMAASGTIGWAGTIHDKYDYPGLYTNDDFHHCTSKDGGIDDWNSLYQVQECELLGLADLNTGSAKVQATIEAYLKDLLSLGVKGFRIDAAKHIAVADLKPIVASLPADTTFMYEVYDGVADPAEYRKMGNTFAFDWAKSTKALFSTPGILKGQASPAILATNDQSDASISLITNHDTERDGSTLNYKAGNRFELANEFMLAIPYGKPMVYSGYAFSLNDPGPNAVHDLTSNAVCPSAPSSATANKIKDGSFVCEHQWPGILGLVQFHKTVGDAPVQNVYSSGNAYGFSRGNLGFVLFNTGTGKFAKTVSTSMAPGVYCNQALVGTLSATPKCSTAQQIKVAANGSVKLNLTGWSAVAISAAGKIK